MANTQNEPLEPELSIDMAAVVALEPGKTSVLGKLDGLVVSAERTPSGGLFVTVAENGSREPFALFDEEEFAELQKAVEDEMSELQDAKDRGEIDGDVGVLTRMHRHKRRKCRPEGVKIDCRVRRCGNGGKNIDHLDCKGIFGRYLCWCRD